MPANKVVYYGETLMDISDSTVTPEKMVTGITAYDKTGEKITGTLSPLTVYTGSAPDNSVGADGDIFLVVT